MKKIALIAMAAMVSTVAVAQKSFTLKGSVPASENDKKAYLYDYNTQNSIDSAKIVNGKFEFKVNAEKPIIARVFIEKSRIYEDVIVENFPVELVLEENGASSLKAQKGLNAAYANVVDRSSKLNIRAEYVTDSLKKIYADDRNAMSEAFMAVVMPEVELFYDYMTEQMKANKDNVLGVYLAWKVSEQRAETLEQLDELLAIVPMAKEFEPLKIAREQFLKVEATGPGKMFVDFGAQSVEGQDVKLSDYVGKGKYVLVDFWASWCGPCMQEVPNLKYLHETYPDLVVLGVNVWDKHDKFLEALKKKGMTWTSIYASDDKGATDLYGIQGIPTIILFAPDGKIVDRTLRGEKMKEYIKELFKK